jgi:hypothetical protein
MRTSSSICVGRKKLEGKGEGKQGRQEKERRKEEGLRRQGKREEGRKEKVEGEDPFHFKLYDES